MTTEDSMTIDSLSVGRLSAGVLHANLAVEFRAIAPFEASDEAPPVAATDEQAGPPPSTWSGVLCVEDVATGDGRLIMADALTWETPMPLRMVLKDVGGHDGAEVCGRILTAERDGALIRATGDFDMESDCGREAARLVHSELMNGVSVDLDDVKFEVRWLDENGNEVVDDPSEEGMPAEEEADGTEEMLMAYSAARIRAATLVAIPAFIEARISSDTGTVDDTPAEGPDAGQTGGKPDAVESAAASPAPVVPASVTAGSPPVVPPHEWFSDPHLQGPTALTITRDGRVFGHLAAWDTCHTAQPEGPGICTAPPRSAIGYARFHLGAVETTAGVISTGRITMGTGHAPWNARPQAAAAHYDHTGTAVADVRAGEDAHGIWVAGALRPGVTAEQIRTLRASPLSGDWRMLDGNLELHAALAVNVPGFPVPRPSGMVAGGQVVSLVASGMIAPPRVRRRDHEGHELTDSDLSYLKRMARQGRARERASLTERVDASRALANRHRAAALAARVRSTTSV